MTTMTEDTHLRTWRIPELSLELEMHETGRFGEFGRYYIAYTLRQRGEVVFQGDDYGIPAGQSPDSLDAATGLLFFLGLRPGDTDRDYFDGYTERQWRFVEESAEDLQMWVSIIEEEQVRTCDDCGLIETHEGGGPDWVHGLCGRCAPADWDHPWLDDWRYIVANGDTLDGFRSYVESRREEEAEDE